MKTRFGTGRDSKMRLASLRGFTLVETISTLLILVILMSALFWMLLLGKTTWQSSVARSSGRQDLQVASRKIEQELRDSSADLITNNTSGTPRSFSFLSAFDNNGKFVTNSSGVPVWQKYVIYYIPSGTKKLLRKEVYGSFTAPLTIPQLTAYCDGSGRLISSSIVSLSLIPNLTDNSAALSVSIQNTNLQGKVDLQSLTATIFLRN